MQMQSGRGRGRGVGEGASAGGGGWGPNGLVGNANWPCPLFMLIKRRAKHFNVFLSRYSRAKSF